MQKMIYKVLVAGILFGICLAGILQTASAQTVTSNNDLIFGALFPGIPKSITKYTAGAAAEFLVSGTTGSEVSIDFTLPTYMNSGGFNMQMVFLETDCSLETRPNPDQSNPQRDNLNPWQTIIDRLGSQGITVWLGGMVIPKLNQLPGNYSATIVITVAYTGG